MPIDRQALLAAERLPFRITGAKHGPKKHTFRAVLEADAAAAFDVTVVPRFATAKVTIAPDSEAAAQALFDQLNRFLEQPVAKLGGEPAAAKLDADFHAEPDDPLLMMKLFLARKDDVAELYFDVDPPASTGWFRRKYLGDVVLVRLLAAAMGMK